MMEGQPGDVPCMPQVDRQWLNCVGGQLLREHRAGSPAAFRVPFVWPVAIGGTAASLFVMAGLPRQAWERFGIWLVIGLVLYFLYGYTHSRIRDDGGRPLP